MAAGYGILRGRPDRWVREDGGDATPHLQIRVLDADGQPWRVAVNVRSDTGSDVVYWLVDPLIGHPVLAALPGLPSGFGRTSAPAGPTLDFVRAPLFGWESGTALPASASASADDLQDLLSLHLQHCRDAGGELFAFGGRFDRNLHKPIDVEFGNTDGLHGIHEIHLNQGNKGKHAQENGAFHDGGLILAHPDRFAGLFLAFQTQWVPTDSSGAPADQSRPIAELIVHRPPLGTTASVYLERALLNPSGDDAGAEVVVIGNLTTETVDVKGWTLVDRNHRVTTIDSLVLPPGGSGAVELDGTGVQLGNKGGNLLLLDPDDQQVDAVVFTAGDAATENRFVRFNR